MSNQILIPGRKARNIAALASASHEPRADLRSLASKLSPEDAIRALVITNMYPSAGDPARGSFVRDQVEELRRLEDVEVELYAFRSRGLSSYARAARGLRRRFAAAAFDVVHSHFGLTIWPSLVVGGAPHVATLHGTDLVHPRSRAITLAGLPFVDLVAPVSHQLARLVPRRLVRGGLAILPCGVDLRMFRRIDRRQARRALGLDEDGPYLLFPADPARPEKRFDRAQAVAGEVPLLTLGSVDRSEVPLWINAANAVLIPSQRESFGTALLEALACEVPVLTTPVGIAPQVLREVTGTHCAPFDVASWSRAVDALVAAPDPRVAGRRAAERYSAVRMAERVRDAWAGLLG